MHPRVVRPESGGSFIAIDRLSELALCLQHKAQIAVSRRKIRSQRERVLIAGDCLVQLVQPPQCIPFDENRFDKVTFQLLSPSAADDRFVRFSFLQPEQTEFAGGFGFTASIRQRNRVVERRLQRRVDARKH